MAMKRIIINTASAVVLSVVTVFFLSGCSNIGELISQIEYAQIYDVYGYTDSELCDYEINRLDQLLEANGVGEYTIDDKQLRNYKYTSEEFKKIDGIDDTYLYAMYFTSNRKSVDEFARALGYDDLNDYLSQHNYIKNGYINGRKWYRDNILKMATMKKAEDSGVK